MHPLGGGHAVDVEQGVDEAGGGVGLGGHEHGDEGVVRDVAGLAGGGEVEPAGGEVGAVGGEEPEEAVAVDGPEDVGGGEVGEAEGGHRRRRVD